MLALCQILAFVKRIHNEIMTIPGTKLLPSYLIILFGLVHQFSSDPLIVHAIF